MCCQTRNRANLVVLLEYQTIENQINKLFSWDDRFVYALVLVHSRILILVCFSLLAPLDLLWDAVKSVQSAIMTYIKWIITSQFGQKCVYFLQDEGSISKEGTDNSHLLTFLITVVSVQRKLIRFPSFCDHESIYRFIITYLIWNMIIEYN